MKRYFCETNAYNCVIFVDENGNGYVVHEENFDEPLTIEVARNADYSNFDGCETAEECAAAIGTAEAKANVIDFIDEEWENVCEI